MTTLKEYNNYGEEIKQRLLLRTYPIAVKLLEKEEDIPEGAIRPKNNHGIHLGLCQGFTMSRREHKMVAMLKEDHWCYVPVVAFGMAENPDFILDGNMDFPGRVASLEAARHLAEISPRLEMGRCIGVLSAPLETAIFEPDVVVIYCNTGQLRCLLVGIRYKEGYVVTTRLEPGGACVQAIVPVMQSGECQVTVPCGGDRRHALAQDDEMIFSLPVDRLEDLVLGLRHFDEHGFGYEDFCPDLRPEYPMGEAYYKVGRMIGLDMPE
ncbi:DUF169 domain-containing protein [Chloroflexota bacterium]